MVHQELQPIPARTVAENIWLGRYPTKKAGPITMVDHAKMYKDTDDLLKKLQEQKKEREKVIRLLRNVSIRLPLLIYGAKVDLTESIKMADFITLVDEESWQEFMPKTVDKPLFRKLLKYYDEDVVSGRVCASAAWQRLRTSCRLPSV